jgi:hypothetical protein
MREHLDLTDRNGRVIDLAQYRKALTHNEDPPPWTPRPQAMRLTVPTETDARAQPGRIAADLRAAACAR